MTIWRAGMLAVCVDDGPPKTLGGRLEADREYIANLKKGEIYRISHVVVGNFDPSFVGLGDINKRAGGCSTRFRPLNDAEDDASLIARIKRCKPARKPVEA